MMNILTFDLENWLESSLEIMPKDSLTLDEQIKHFDKFIEPNTLGLLRTLDRYAAKATFFVLGTIAHKHPGLIKMISSKGHEIASHSLVHQCIYKRDKVEFKADVLDSISSLEMITNRKVLGFRAPYFSITKDSLWALDILKECGLKYDSSIFPFERRSLYGIKNALRFPNEIRDSFWEFPLSTVRFMNINIPVSGGGYFRFLPYWLIRLCIRKINFISQPVVLYFHPYEFNTEEFRKSFFGDSTKAKIIKYCQAFGRNSMIGKLEALLSEFKFTSIKDFLKIEGKL